MYKNRNLEWLVLIGLILFLMFRHIIAFSGYYGWDDMEYAQLSYQWAKGNFALSENHFSYRFPIIFLTGLSYKLFGVNDMSSAIPTLLLTFLILLSTFTLLKNSDSRIIITTLIIEALTFPFFYYSDKPMTDIYVAFGVWIFFASTYYYRYQSKKYPIFYSFIAISALFFAFLAKETTVLIAPSILFIILRDLFKKQFLNFWMYFFIFGLFFFITYHYIIFIETGSPWSRYLSIYLNSYENPCNYENYPFYYTLQRIGYQWWYEIIINYLFVPFIFILAYLILNLKKKKEQPYFFASIFTFVAVISANFMTKSYHHYSPMCLDIRHYLYLVPLLAFSGAPTIVYYFFNFKKNKLWICFLFISVILLFNYSLNKLSASVIIIYFLITLLLFIKNLYSQNKVIYFIFFLLLWVIEPVNEIIHSQQSGFNTISTFIEQHIKTIKQPTAILTDPVMKRIADYYMKWDSSTIHFFNEQNPNIPKHKEYKNYYVYHNGLTWWLSESYNKKLMIFWYLDTPYLSIIKKDKYQCLYTIKYPDSIRYIRSTHSYFFDFEHNAIRFFSYPINHIVKDKFGKANLIYSNNYSVTFTLPLTQILTKYTTKIEILIKGQIKTMATNAHLVLSIENNDSIYFWLGKKLCEFIKKDSSWQYFSVQLSYSFTHNNSMPQVLKIYFWNTDIHPILLDNWYISIDNIEHL